MARQVSRTPTLETIMDLVVDSHLLETHTAMPGKVDSFDNQRAGIIPQLRDKKNGKLVDLPIILSVPIVFPRFGKFVITAPIEKDLTGLLIFCEKSIDDWLKNGTVSTPRQPRRHNLSDAVFLPGLSAFSDLITSFDGTNFVIRTIDNVGTIKMEPGGKVTINGNLEVLI